MSTSTPTLARRVLGVVRRRLWIIIVLAAVLLLAWFKLWAPVRVQVVRVDRGLVIEEAFGRGTIESQREAAIGFDLVGRLSEVLVEEGTRVSLGQELARLETDQVQADVQAAQTGIAAARAQLKRIAADEARARVVLAAAEREATRTQALVAGGAVPGQQGDEANDVVRVARADLDRVLAQRSEATRGIDVAAGGAAQRQATMVRATLLAPFDGLVTRRLREPGDTVTVGTTVLRLVDTSQVYVNASIDETVLPRLAPEQPSTILFPGTNASVAGHVTRVSWEADRQTHEVLVEVTPDSVDRRVAIGQRADVRIELARRDNVVRIPLTMIHHDATGAFLYVDRQGSIAIVRPVFGLTGEDTVEVLEGVVEGDSLLAALSGTGSLPVGRRWRAK